MASSHIDRKILSYNDVVLRESDLDILRGPCYLNDRIIEFYFCYLSSILPSNDVLLVSPSITFWIMNCPDASSLTDFVKPLKFSEKNLIIFAVNDNENVSQAQGGSHWSLLTYTRKKNVFAHHDSLMGLNHRYAMKLYEVVKRYACTSNSTDPFCEYKTPQQSNGYDCGLYILAITKVIYTWHLNEPNECSEDLWLTSMECEINASSITNLRKEILKLILDMMINNQER